MNKNIEIIKSYIDTATPSHSEAKAALYALEIELLEQRDIISGHRWVMGEVARQDLGTISDKLSLIDCLKQ